VAPSVGPERCRASSMAARLSGRGEGTKRRRERKVSAARVLSRTGHTHIEANFFLFFFTFLSPVYPRQSLARRRRRNVRRTPPHTRRRETWCTGPSAPSDRSAVAR